MGVFLEWFSFSAYICICLVIGWFSIRKKIIPLQVAEWSVIAVLFVRIIDYVVRVWWGVRVSYPDGTSNIGVFMARTLLHTAAEQTFYRLLILIAIAVGVWAVLSLLAHKTHERFMDQPDVIVLSLGILIAGWPYFLVYLFLVFVFTAVGGVGYLLIFRRKVKEFRFPITPYFVLAGLTTILWGVEIAKYTGIYAIR